MGGGVATGLCASFKNTVLASPSIPLEDLESFLSPSNLDLIDPACGCTDDVKALWNEGAFVGHWSGGTFVNACPGSGHAPGPSPTPLPMPTPAPAVDTLLSGSFSMFPGLVSSAYLLVLLVAC